MDKNDMTPDVINPEMTADEAMTYLKGKKGKVTRQDLQNFYDSAMQLMDKFRRTNQVAAAKKLLFHIDCCEHEMTLVDMGIDTFIYDDDVRYYMKQVATNDVKLIELEFYEREIPDDIIEVIEKTKGLFTGYWVLYTDYAQSQKDKDAQRKVVEQARISRDPILFGVHLSEEHKTFNERYYFLGDWVDQYCDLTLEKFLDGMKSAGKNGVEHKISTPVNLDEMRKQLDKIEMQNGYFRVVEKEISKPTFFSRIRTFFHR